jgi:hypothetical protein
MLFRLARHFASNSFGRPCSDGNHYSRQRSNSARRRIRDGRRSSCEDVHQQGRKHVPQHRRQLLQPNIYRLDPAGITVSGPTLAQNPLEDVANPHPLRCRIASEKPAAARVLGSHITERLISQAYVINFTQNSTCKPENIFLYLLIHKIRLYLWTLKRHLLPAW